MSELISGKEALIALANGKEVEIESNKQWVSVENCSVYQFLRGNHNYEFRLKPKIILINNIEVPAPFKPEDGDKFWIISDDYQLGYTSSTLMGGCVIGVWRTEDEIKQVVAALRSVFEIK